MVSNLKGLKILADSVRNVIESGEVFTTSHLEILERTLDEVDSKKAEVQQFLKLIKSYLNGDKKR